MATVPSIGRAAPEGDATRALYEQYAGQIYRYCLHQLGSREEAEDAVQSTFLNAFRGLKRGVVPDLESAWLFKIAHNVCLSRRRSTWRRGRIESPADFQVVEELAPAPSRRADELIGLQDVLEQMPEQQRRAILLREWQGLSYREIAEELELSQSAVETLIFRARRSLAHGLEQPPAVQRRRARSHAGVLGNLASWAQSFFFGGAAAVKVAATVAVVGAGAVVATAPVQHGPAGRPQPIAPAIAPVVTHRPAPAAGDRPARAVPAAHTVPGRQPPAAAATPPAAVATTPALQTTTDAPPQQQATPGDVGHEDAAPPGADHEQAFGPAEHSGPAKHSQPAKQPEPSPAAKTPPANGKADPDEHADGSGAKAPPGQTKKDDGATVPPGRAKRDDGETVPPGQAKKTDASPAPDAPVSLPEPVTQPETTPAVTVAAPPAETVPAPVARGNGNGNGHGEDDGNGHGKPDK